MIRFFILLLAAVLVIGGGVLYFWDFPVEQTMVEERIDDSVLQQ